MRERLDCAILEIGDPGHWNKPKEGVYAKGRLHLHRMQAPQLRDGDSNVLLEAALSLQRFDVCLLVVGETNLARVRRTMLEATPQMRTPVIGVLCKLKAPAIDDLYNLGMADFVRDPLCPEEIRIRTERLLNMSRPAHGGHYVAAAGSTARAVSESAGWYLAGGVPSASAGATSAGAAGPDACRQLADHGRGMLHTGVEPADIELEAFAVASASRCARTDDSFGAAKSKVVERFERAYLLASLAKSSGNIAMAARGAKKHRRAYWALMQKYDIDAAPFRKGLPPDE